MASNGAGKGLLCGEMRFQHKGCRYVLDALPPVFVIRYDASGNWLNALLEMGAEVGFAGAVFNSKNVFGARRLATGQTAPTNKFK